MDWQKAFLTRITQRIKLANTISDWIQMAGGVPQGTLSVPENFLKMVDDLHTDVDDVKFVDDVTLYEVCNTHSQNKLHNAVNDIQEWETDNNMSLNTSKPKNFWFTLEERSLTSHVSQSMVMLLNAYPAPSYTWMPHHVQPVVGRPRRQSCVASKPSAPPTEGTEESRPLY